MIIKTVMKTRYYTIFCCMLLCITISAKQNEACNVQADALIAAYLDDDYEVFAELFPDTYSKFLDLFAYDSPLGEDHILVEKGYVFFSFLFSDSRVLNSNILNKILGISYGFIWNSDNRGYFVGEVLSLSMNHPQEISNFLSNKTDYEIISYFRLCLQTLWPDNSVYLRDVYQPLLALYSKYSQKYELLIKQAFIAAGEDAEHIVI